MVRSLANAGSDFCSPQNDGAQEVSDEVEDDDGNDERAHAKGDLEVAPAAPGIHRQGGHHDRSGLFRLDGVVSDLFGMGTRAHCNQGSMTRMCTASPALA